MGAEDLKELFPEEKSKSNEKLELVEDLSFTVGSAEEKAESNFEFQNLPEGNNSASNSQIVDLATRMAALENKLASMSNDASESPRDNNVLKDEVKMLDRQVTKILQQILKANPKLKPHVMAVKKLVVEFSKKIS